MTITELNTAIGGGPYSNGFEMEGFPAKHPRRVALRHRSRGQRLAEHVNTFGSAQEALSYAAKHMGLDLVASGVNLKVDSACASCYHQLAGRTVRPQDSMNSELEKLT